jgi:hypothetical protein
MIRAFSLHATKSKFQSGLLALISVYFFFLNWVAWGGNREEDNEMATENAVAALGKVLEFHGGVIEASAAAQSWDVWINSLPLVEDKVEARHVHAQLVRHIQASDARCAIFHHPLVTTRWH